MFKPLTYPPQVEPLVQLIEETPKTQIVERACELLRQGQSTEELLLASGLAVIRSCDVPTVHHGGSLHPICGLHPARQLSRRLPGRFSLIPVVQHVALANNHIQNVTTGPYILPEIRIMSVNDSVEDTLERLRYHIKHGEHYGCESYFPYLRRRMPADQLFNILLNVAVAKNEHDDHLVLLPTYCWRLLAWFGETFADHLLRPAVRYVTRPPVVTDTIAVDRLIEEFQLRATPIPQHSGENETTAVQALSRDIGNCELIQDIPAKLAQALASGLSLEGAGEALSVGGSHLLLRSQSADVMGDVHLNTGANARRFLIRQPALDVRLKLRCLLGWASGPDVLRAGRNLAPAGEAVSEDHAEPDSVDAEHGLEALRDHLCALPGSAEQLSTNNGESLCGEGVTRALTVARKYLKSARNSGIDRESAAEALLELLGELVCTDHGSEFHLYKHYQAIREEYQSTRASLGQVHLLAAVKATAISLRGDESVYSRAIRELTRH